MGKRPVALALYSLRDVMADDFLGKLEKVKEMGYEGVEFAGSFITEELTAEMIRAKLDELGLVGISSHVMVDRFENDLEGVMDEAVVLGQKYIAVPALRFMFMGQGVDCPEYAAFKELAPKIAEAAKKRGLQLMFHNHNMEFDLKVDGKYALEDLLDCVPDDGMMAELDVYWATFAGLNPAEYLKTGLKGRCPVLHAKDMDETKRDREKEATDMMARFAGLVPVGEGTLKWPEILEAAVEDGGAQWVVVEQDISHSGDPMGDAKKSRENLKKLGF